MKVLLSTILSLLATACSQKTLLYTDDLEMSIGWLHGNCLAIKNKTIALPHTFTLVHLDKSRSTENAEITQKATTGEACYPLLTDRLEVNSDSGYSFYLVKSELPVNLGIGLLDKNNTKDIEYSYCNTTEGIRFFISSQNTIIWEGYYYLGYESEPTCGI